MESYKNHNKIAKNATTLNKVVKNVGDATKYRLGQRL
jgi:hypothetical protein